VAIALRDHFATGNLAVGEPKAARDAAKLGHLLLGPVADRMGATHLLILPDGALRYVPFAALAAKGETQGGAWPDRPLIVDHDIVRLPSASVLALLREERKGRRPAPRAVAVLAHPVFQDTDPRLPERGHSPHQAATSHSAPSAKIGSLPDLPFSESEAQGILRLVPAGEGFSALAFDANLETAMSPKLGLYKMVHFATHSLLDERPDLSGLVLSRFDGQGRPRDGFLTVLDLYDLHLPAELVVLSACRTDQGEDMSGEGIGRLTRGFLYAGARRVVVTQWSIRDKATAELMVHFYGNLLHDQPSPSAALRQAQLSLRADPKWRSPYYWAGFVLEGEP
jgi:CHAT domain-containing protein